MHQDEERWQAVERRDRAEDDSFVYAVKTTGIFCRPTCASRRPLRRNVEFFGDAAAAALAGYRACRRCQPATLRHPEPAALAVRDACRAIDADPASPPNYTALAAAAGLSAAHFHRTFKRAMGVTPKQYADAAKLRLLKLELRQGSDVTGSVYRSGYGSSSRVYERSDAQLGMPPGVYRRGGEGEQITYASASTVLGRMMLAATDRGLCFLQFGESEEALFVLLRKEFPRADLQSTAQPKHPHLRLWIAAVQAYLRGEEPSPALPVDLRATAFQLRVWNYLQQIPAGQTRSYSQVAADLGHPSATRAVSGACAANRVALLVPCHRVLRNNGELGGYRWGVERKRALLEMETASSAVAAAG